MVEMNIYLQLKRNLSRNIDFGTGNDEVKKRFSVGCFS